MELANILELIHAVSDSDLTEFNLQAAEDLPL